MCLQSACIRRCIITLVAFDWLFSTVGFQMSPHICLKISNHRQHFVKKTHPRLTISCRCRSSKVSMPNTRLPFTISNWNLDPQVILINCLEICFIFILNSNHFYQIELNIMSPKFGTMNQYVYFVS